MRSPSRAIIIARCTHNRPTVIDDGHDHQSKYPAKLVDSAHPTLKSIANNRGTPMGEYYIIEKRWPNAKALATSMSANMMGKRIPPVWVNQYGKACVFVATDGHSGEPGAGSISHADIAGHALGGRTVG